MIPPTYNKTEGSVFDEEWYIYNNGERVYGLPLDLDYHAIPWNYTDPSVGDVSISITLEEQYLWNNEIFRYNIDKFTNNTIVAFS
jgi:hypothetical protein